MEQIPQLIKGGQHTDTRGTINFINDFDMKSVRRFYRILHTDTGNKRGWRGHKIEQRWFTVCKGAFEIKIVKIDNWKNPDKTIASQVFQLDNNNTVLHVPQGYATCLQALEADSEILVFADSEIKDAVKDDYLFPVDYFN